MRPTVVNNSLIIAATIGIVAAIGLLDAELPELIDSTNRYEVSMTYAQHDPLSDIEWTDEQKQVIRKLYTSLWLVWHKLKETNKLTNDEKELWYASQTIMEHIIPRAIGSPWLLDPELTSEWD